MAKAKDPASYPLATVQAFNRFFAAYPHRRPNPRVRALAAFARVVADRGVDAEDLIAAAGRWTDEVREHRIRSISVPHAATWLNQGDYEDYLTPDAPASAEPHQPEPEHPMAHDMDWARPLVAAGPWTSWFGRLTAEVEDGRTIITAPTAFIRDRLRNEYRPLFLRHYGEVTWRVEGQDR